MRRRLLNSPTLTLLVAFVAVFALQAVVGLLAGPLTVQSLFALSTPVTVRPWTVVTSIYAHGSVSHLVANAIALVIVGLPLERETTPLRFHGFFLATGALAGLAEVWFAALAGAVLPGVVAQVNVLGASGAVFALLGYLLTSNRITDRVVGSFEVTGRAQLLLLAVAAAAITVVTGGQQVALVAHFTGLLLGLLAGRVHVLRSSAGHPAPDAV